MSVNIPNPADRKHNKNYTFICVVSKRSIFHSNVLLFPEDKHSLFVFWPLASVFWNNATLKDLQVVLDLVGISAEAVEEVVVFHRAPLGAVRRKRGLGGSQAAHRVTYYPQHLHLEERGHASAPHSYNKPVDKTEARAVFLTTHQSH